MAEAPRSFELLKCKVEKSIPAEFRIGYISLNSDNTLLVAGERDGTEMLKRLNLQTGEELGSVDLEFEPFGLAVVELGGRKTVALSYGRDKQVIEFRDANNLGSILHSHEVAPHVPFRLCVSSPSTLLYEDGSKEAREVHILDCSGAEPKPEQGKNIIKTQLEGLYDMCMAQDGDRELLICTGINNNQLEAYNIATDELVWSLKGKVDGMDQDMDPRDFTTDGRGHLFVCDPGNKCIQMFHVADGRYLGALQVDGSQGFEYPVEIRWCDATSSLIVSVKHIENRVRPNDRIIHVVSVEQN